MIKVLFDYEFWIDGFLALTGLSNDQDSYTMAIAAKAACLRVALSHLKSLFIGDELSVLFRKDGFSAMVGELCATARKDGLSIVLSSQDPDTICQSPRECISKG